MKKIINIDTQSGCEVTRSEMLLITNRFDLSHCVDCDGDLIVSEDDYVICMTFLALHRNTEVAA